MPNIEDVRALAGRALRLASRPRRAARAFSRTRSVRGICAGLGQFRSLPGRASAESVRAGRGFGMDPGSHRVCRPPYPP